MDYLIRNLQISFFDYTVYTFMYLKWFCNCYAKLFLKNYLSHDTIKTSITDSSL